LVNILDFQKVPVGKGHDIAQLLKVESKGFIFDMPRDAFSKRNLKTTSSLFATLETMKDRELVSGKYGGCIKELSKKPIVIFANCSPNLAKLSIDRWVLFHTRLG
jgi:hypothetical protein